MIAPHKGILPPKNPSKSLPPKPDFLSSSSCSSAKDTTACNDLVLSATSNARNLLEKLGPMSFSLSAYEKLTGAEQLFVTANVERVGRGLAPMLELTNSLDSLAQAGAKANTDPDIDRIIKTKLPGGGRVISAGANFASGYDNPLGSNYGWMYDDGLGSPNSACTSKNPQACWGHRDNILHAYGSTSACGGTSFESVMGAGYVKSGAVFGAQVDAASDAGKTDRRGSRIRHRNRNRDRNYELGAPSSRSASQAVHQVGGLLLFNDDTFHR